MREALPLDLLACAAVALLVLLVTLLPPKPIASLAAPLGLALICLLPGYLLISALFPRNDTLSGRGRLLLSLGADLLLAVLLGLALSFTPRGLHLASFAVALSFLALFFAIAAYFRWREQPRRRRLVFDYSRSFRHLRLTGRSRSRKHGHVLALLIVLIGAIVVSALAYGVINNRTTSNSTDANESSPNGLTEFYVLWPGGGNEGHLATVLAGSSSAGIVGIVNREDGPVNYTLQLNSNNSTVLSKEIRLERNESWEGPLGYIFEAPGIKSVDVLLYRDENFEQPYREDHLMINVSANESVNSTLNKSNANLGQRARVMAVAMGSGGSNGYSYGSAAPSYVEPSHGEEIPQEDKTDVEKTALEIPEEKGSSLTMVSAASPAEQGSAALGMPNLEENVSGSYAQNASTAGQINESKNLSQSPANKSTISGANFASTMLKPPGLNFSAIEGTGRLNNTACDDGDPCTIGDSYSGGRCSGIPVNCNDRNACTNDTCDSGTGQCNHAPIGCEDDNPCTDDTCNFFSGCVNTPNAAKCEDSNACTTTDTCSDGRCSGTPLNCDDDNVCTEDSCNPATGCVNSPNAGSCDDGNACTTGDTCSGGNCSGKSLDCNDRNPCTSDSCDSVAGCVHTQLKDGTACKSDGNPCTQDLCLSGTCTHTQKSCDDGNVCTDDSCDPIRGCVNVRNSRSCDDGNACTTGDTCSGGVCSGKPCDDNNPCTTDACDSAAGCVHAPLADGAACTSDGNSCTDDVCLSGTCTHTQESCDDGNVCTDDSCDPAIGCLSTPNARSCDDGNACTTNDTCSGGICSGMPLNCDDGNVCTEDSCNPATGCVNSPNAGSCDDGNACTTGDTCLGGSCSGKSLDCNDRNPCTSDSCDSVAGCVHTQLKDGTACTSDGNLCTDDVCLSGTCTHTQENCDDGNVCTDDSCDPIRGCVNAPNARSCDDGNACTTNDTCSGGRCSGTPLNCDDGNVCTEDSCNPATGCVYMPNTHRCDDSNTCTTNDTCSGGVCSGRLKDCDDHNSCTTDTCDSADGCVHTVLGNGTACTSDGNSCTDDVCSSGICTHPQKSCDDGETSTTDSCDPATGCVHSSEIDQWVKSRSMGASSNEQQNFTSENIRYIKGQGEGVVIGKGESSTASGQSSRGIRVG